MNIVIMLGAPGSGKGTVAGKLASEHSNLRHVSSGDLLRGAVAKGTAAGQEAKGYMEAGKLVPDALIATMIKDVVAETTGDVTMLLDGFPRNVAQAEILAEMGAPVTGAVLLDVADDVIFDRIAGRRTCPKCKAGYHEGRGHLRQVRRRADYPQGRQSRHGEGSSRRLPSADRAAHRLLPRAQPSEDRPRRGRPRRHRRQRLCRYLR